MGYPEYESDLHHIHQSEVYGSNVFKMAGRLTFSSAKSARWALLHELEIQTLERFISYMNATGQEYHYPYGWALKGHLEGFILGLLPWSLAMRILARETQSFIAVWQRLKTNASTPERGFFDYIYAHEKAIEAFATRELALDENSTKPILSLLDVPIFF